MAKATKPPAADRQSQDISSYRRQLLLCIVLIAAFLRFYHLPSIPVGIQIDEAMNGSNILQIQETGEYQVFYPENMGREGLFINLQAIASSILGNEPWVLRSVAAVFGVLTVWTTYLVAAELFSFELALFASFFVATSFWHLMLSRLGTRAITAPFFLTLAVWLLLIAVGKARERQQYLGWFGLAGAAFGLGFHGYTAFRVSPVLIGGLLLYFFVAAKREGWLPDLRKAAAAYLATAFAFVLPLLLYFASHPEAAMGRASQISVFKRAQNPTLEILRNIWKEAQMFFWEGDLTWRHNYNGRPELFWPVAILFAVGIAIAANALWKAIGTHKGDRTVLGYGIAVAWIALGAVPAVLSGEGVPHALRSVLMIPAVCMMAAVGAIWALRFVPAKAAIPVLAAFLLFVAWDPYHTYFDLWASHPNTSGHYSMSLFTGVRRHQRNDSISDHDAGTIKSVDQL